jgi:hypothetical protein
MPLTFGKLRTCFTSGTTFRIKSAAYAILPAIDLDKNEAESAVADLERIQAAVPSATAIRTGPLESRFSRSNGKPCDL